MPLGVINLSYIIQSGIKYQIMCLCTRSTIHTRFQIYAQSIRDANPKLCSIRRAGAGCGLLLSPDPPKVLHSPCGRPTLSRAAHIEWLRQPRFRNFAKVHSAAGNVRRASGVATSDHAPPGHAAGVGEEDLIVLAKIKSTLSMAITQTLQPDSIGLSRCLRL